VAAVLVTCVAVGASADDRGDYAAAVGEAAGLVASGQHGDRDAAQRASRLLEQHTGNTQPEILQDLSRTPPDLADASLRLRALSAELDHPADTANPAAAQQRLHEVLSMRRYDAMRAGPSALDRLLSFIGDQLLKALAAAIRFLLPAFGSVSGPLDLVRVGILLAALAVVLGGLAWLGVLAAGRFRGDAVSASKPVREGEHDSFEEADRLASEGDYQGAIRALASAVSVALGGPSVWNRSPLTVREIFNRAERPESLRSLLVTFEGVIYGHRSLDRDSYWRAAVAAEPFRPGSRAA
jgi:hypothetical protein